MTTLLFPGRHLLHTQFQFRYLRDLLLQGVKDQKWHVPPATDVDAITQIVFAITSCNQANSRYNPFPLHVRAIGTDRFAQRLRDEFSFGYRIIGIPHYRPSSRFAELVLKEINAQTEGVLSLSPKDCVVICSTPDVIQQYRDLGFPILSAELGRIERTPTEVLSEVVQAGEDWQASATAHDDLSETTCELWRDFPDAIRRVLRLWQDPLLNDEGSLTDTRDYSSYAYMMANPSLIRLKLDDLRDTIVPGKIVDEGCADAALLAQVAHEYPDSDLIGIEITGEFLARCKERQRAGEFGESFVHFYQRNITDPILADEGVSTTICNSTIHELWSYGEQQATVESYLQLKFAQTMPAGRLIIRDVVGPANKEQETYLWLNDEDGTNDDPFAEFDNRQLLGEHLSSLSTYSRFLRFTKDFLSQRPGPNRVAYREVSLKSKRYAVLSLRHAAEFIGKMTYTNNWQSEMHEEFAFWDFNEYRQALLSAGFSLHARSRVYVNPWVVENCYKGRVALFTGNENRLAPMEWPPTNIVIIGEKTTRALKSSRDDSPC